MKQAEVCVGEKYSSKNNNYRHLAMEDTPNRHKTVNRKPSAQLAQNYA